MVLQICDRIKIEGWKVIRDPGGRIGPYATSGDQWVSFDDDFMVRHKAEYVRAMGLAGSMAWALDLDDFSGSRCGCGKSPLLATLNHVLRDKEAPPPCPLYACENVFYLLLHITVAFGTGSPTTSFIISFPLIPASYRFLKGSKN